jgi:membrane associated rhomboid family serine protease
MKTTVARSASQVARSLTGQTVTLAASVGAMWGVFAVNAVLGGALIAYGIVPRTETGLAGIVIAPFVHASLNHLLANTVPFALFGWMVMLRDRRHFLVVTLLSALVSGLFAWTLGAPGSVHVGASGVIFGYLGFLLLSGWYARGVASIALSVLVAVLWGGMVTQVLPGVPGVSWQSHLGGFIGGVLAARVYRVRR